MPKVKFLKEKKEIEVLDGANLRQEAREAGIEIYPGIHKLANCRGLGFCWSCRMNIKRGREHVSQPGFWEKFNFRFNPIGLFTRVNHEDELRLSCQTTVHGDIEVETQPGFNWHGEKFWS